MEARAVVVLEVVEGLLVGPEQRRRCPQLLYVCNIYQLGVFNKDLTTIEASKFLNMESLSNKPGVICGVKKTKNNFK